MRCGKGHLRSGERPELFDAAEPDSVGFAESSIDGSSLGDSHFATTDQGRCIGGIGIAVTDESLRAVRLEDRCAEDPAFDSWITQLLLDNCSDSSAAVALSYAEEA
jgi:hypothetical protein